MFRPVLVSYVNIGLDQPFYTGVNTMSDPNNLLVLCNKYHQLPDGYEPSDLVQISQTNSNGGKTLYLQENVIEWMAEGKPSGYPVRHKMQVKDGALYYE